MGTEYHLKSGYVERLEPEYWLDESGDIVWQPDVYLEAVSLAERLGATGIIDIGCGNAEKLAALRGEFEIAGVDFGANIEACRARYDWGEWIDADLDADDSPLPVPSPEDAIVVCADVIEHVVHPERLLRKLHDLLARGASALVLTTPERDLRRGRNHSGPSPNAAHVREWTLEELRRFMADEGLEGCFGLTRTNDTEPYLHTILAVVPGAAIGQHFEEIARWWSYRERWQEIARRHESLIRKTGHGLWARGRGRLRRTVRRMRAAFP